jgi:predicted nuclease of predicted toxin-antitoxin system
MKILLDECVPKKVKRFLAGHDVSTVQEIGLASTKNGKLLAAAESAGFDILITADKSMPYQQRVKGRNLAVVQLPTNTLEELEPLAESIRSFIETVTRGGFYRVEFP